MPVLKNPNHERFAQELAKGKTQIEAYEVAGYAPNDGNATKLASRQEVQDRVKEITGKAAEKAGVSIERVLAELAKIGFANMQDYMHVGADGCPVLDFSSLTRDQAAALTEVTVDEMKGNGEENSTVQRVKFKLADKRAALVDLGKHLGMFKDRIEHSGPGGGPIETKDISPRATLLDRIAGIAARRTSSGGNGGADGSAG